MENRIFQNEQACLQNGVPKHMSVGGLTEFLFIQFYERLTSIHIAYYILAFLIVFIASWFLLSALFIPIVTLWYLISTFALNLSFFCFSVSFHISTENLQLHSRSWSKYTTLGIPKITKIQKYLYLLSKLLLKFP